MRGVRFYIFLLFTCVSFICIYNLEILCICIFGALGAGINERQEVPLGSSWQPQPHLTLPAGSDCTTNL